MDSSSTVSRRVGSRQLCAGLVLMTQVAAAVYVPPTSVYTATGTSGSASGNPASAGGGPYNPNGFAAPSAPQFPPAGAPYVFSYMQQAPGWRHAPTGYYPGNGAGNYVKGAYGVGSGGANTMPEEEAFEVGRRKDAEPAGGGRGLESGMAVHDHAGDDTHRRMFKEAVLRPKTHKKKKRDVDGSYSEDISYVDEKLLELRLSDGRQLPSVRGIKTMLAAGALYGLNFLSLPAALMIAGLGGYRYLKSREQRENAATAKGSLRVSQRLPRN
ncbi:hypothetical protein BESB_044220 [Besnoitia besnoiti]|uniref:Transmembrane protein n=1 Tax=Besnoitia besnoiti TaxID=94643 RepID=A0A2A9ML98_BESBE|nr:hypothetical protein BESB_044220 [Besnoitia besnoiti]PFH36230.1 hypothetical protein BESB_044220 [Besnoitia besnoiti]